MNDLLGASRLLSASLLFAALALSSCATRGTATPSRSLQESGADGSDTSWFFPSASKLAATAVGGLLTLSGQGKMEWPSTGGKNAGQEVGLADSLGMGDRDPGVGAILSYGDGFSGIEAGFLRWQQRTVRSTGTLQANFGQLAQGDLVKTDVLYQRLQLDLLRELFSFPVDKVRLRAAVGFGIHHNEMSWKAMATNAARRQNVQFSDKYGIPMLRARVQGEFRPFFARLDAGYSSGDWGDIDGRVLDLALTLHYKVQKGIYAYAGITHYEFTGKGAHDGLEFDIDNEVRGFIGGLRWEF